LRTWRAPTFLDYGDAVSITLGIFDLFAYAVPGSIYLGLGTYVAIRLGWLDGELLRHGNTTLLVIGGVLVSYLVGHVSYVLGRAAGHLHPGWRDQMDAARATFVERVPAAANRAYVAVDRALLQAAVEVHHHDASLELARLRAVGLMLRNAAPAFGLAALASFVEIGTGRAAPAAFAAILLTAAAIISFSQGHTLALWANMKVLEVAFWIDDIDTIASAPTAPAATWTSAAGHRRRNGPEWRGLYRARTRRTGCELEFDRTEA
jgi:hypothetical protein